MPTLCHSIALAQSHTEGSQQMDKLSQSLPSATYSLSPLDIIASHLYISNCFFFDSSGLHQHDVALEQVLEKGLYYALTKFPILVGELRHSGLNTMHIVVDPRKPNMPGWETAKSSTISFGDLQRHGFHRSHWPEEMDLDGDNDPLLVTPGASPPSKLIRIRVCHFARDSGFAVMVRIAHAVFDAKGVVTFVNHWANCCREQQQQQQQTTPQSSHVAATMTTIQAPDPILSREAMYRELPVAIRPAPLPRLLHALSWILVMLLSVVAFFIKKRRLADGDSESHLFAISRRDLDAVQSKARDRSISVSHNDLIVALFTMAYAQSSNKSKAKVSGSKIKAIMPCDFRHRLGIPEAYTGNCAVGLFVTASSEQLLQPIEGQSIIEAAYVCRKTVDSAADRIIIERLVKRAMQSIRLLGDKARILYSLMVCQAFSDQSRLAFYSVDFGFGPPVLVVPVAYPRTLAVVVPSPPGSEDVYIWLSLQSVQMGRLLQIMGFRSFVRVLY